MLYSSLDAVAWWLLFACLVALFQLAFEAAFRVSHHWHAKQERRRFANAGLVLGSLLALDGIVLAFGFSIADGRFQKRRELVLDEANAIQTTFLRADVLPPRHTEEVRQLLRRYLDVRLGVQHPGDLAPALAASRSIQMALWTEAMAAAREDRDSKTIPLFIESLNKLLDLHEARLTLGTYYRLPEPMLITMFVVSLLAIMVLGMVAGMSARSFWPTLAFIIAVASLLVLVVELDRPWHQLFEVSQGALVDVQKAIANGP